MRLIITNNPKVKEYISNHESGKYYKVVWIEGYLEDVLKSVRDFCHSGHKLITHPLTGSIKPNQTPYKTVVVEPLKAGTTDLDSVLLAEGGLEKALDMLRNRPRPKAAFDHLDDFAVIDLDFFRSYLSSANNYPG